MTRTERIPRRNMPSRANNPVVSTALNVAWDNSSQAERLTFLLSKLAVQTGATQTDPDPLARFLAACVRPALGERIQSSELHEIYVAWCRSAGVSFWTLKAFSLELLNRGFLRKRSNVIWWLDIKSIRSVSDFNKSSAGRRKAGRR